jgi:hypothetical protein
MALLRGGMILTLSRTFNETAEEKCEHISYDMRGFRFLPEIGFGWLIFFRQPETKTLKSATLSP